MQAKSILLATSAMALTMALSACGGGGGGSSPSAPPVVTNPVVALPTTPTPPVVPEQPAPEAPVTEQPVTEPPVTEPPVQEPPVTEQPVTEQPTAPTTPTPEQPTVPDLPVVQPPTVPTVPPPTIPPLPTDPSTPSEPTAPISDPDYVDPFTKITGPTANLPGITPSQFETDEYRAGGGLGMIKASSAYARGVSGEGKTVAVIDDGLNPNLGQLSGRIVTDQAYDYIQGDTDTTPNSDHGTHVATTIAGARDGEGFHGVAYDAKILPLRVFSATEVASYDQMAQAFDRAVLGGADVLNNSWTTSTSITAANKSAIDMVMANFVTSARSAVNAGKVVVFAAGNEGQIVPNVEPGLPYYYPELQKNWLAVVALNQAGDGLASYSNRCGVAKNWCIAAPGTAITGTDKDGNALTMTGTSMAAPHVSGAVALLLQMWPSLTPAEVVEILLRTADDLGETGVDTTYGYGRMNLDTATNPYGKLTLPKPAGGLSSPETSAIESGSAFGSALSKAMASGPRIAVFDQFGRGFSVDLSAFAAEARSRFDAEKTFARFGHRQGGVSVDLGNGTSLRIGFEPGDENRIDQTPMTSASFSFAAGSDRVGLHQNDRPGSLDGLASFASMADTRGSIDAAGLEHPFLGFAETGSAATYSREIAGGVRAGVLALTGKDEYEGSVAGGAATLQFGQTGGARLSLSAGVVLEQDSVLGTRGEDAFTTRGGATTTFGSVAGSVPLSDRFSLVGDAHYGRTTMNGGQGLLSGLDVTSASFNLGAAAQSVLMSGDRMSFTVGQPLRIEAGTVSFQVPTGRGADGALRWSNFSGDAAPDAREIDVRLNWSGQLDEKTDMHFGLMQRFNADQQDGEKETIGMVRWNRRF